MLNHITALAPCACSLTWWGSICWGSLPYCGLLSLLLREPGVGSKAVYAAAAAAAAATGQVRCCGAHARQQQPTATLSDKLHEV